jgi:hypothetical protein
VGRAAWEGTWLALDDAPGARYLDALTGEALSVGEREGRPGLPVEEVLASLPVALLLREGPAA